MEDCLETKDEEQTSCDKRTVFGPLHSWRVSFTTIFLLKDSLVTINRSIIKVVDTSQMVPPPIPAIEPTQVELNGPMV